MKFKHLLLTALCAIVSVCASAQPAVSTPEAGNTYYLYNAKTECFLANNGGTPYVETLGTPWTLEAGDGSNSDFYTLRIKGDNNGYLWGKYWANIAGAWANYPAEHYFKMESATGGYTLNSQAWAGTNNAYLYINESNANRVAANSQEQNGMDAAYAVWQFVSESDYKAYVATKENVDMSWAITNFGCSSFDGWTHASQNGNNAVLNGNAFEYWGWNSDSSSNFDYYQTITNLPGGKYVISANMHNDQTHAGLTFSPCFGVYANNGATEVSKAVDHTGTELAWYATDEITVTNGTLRVGVKNLVEVLNTRWCVVDEFKLTYVGPAVDLSAYVSALNSKLAEAKVCQAAQMNAEVLTALKNAISTYDEKTFDTAVEYETAISALTSVIEKANASIAQYADAATKVAGLDDTGKAAFAASESGVKYAAKTLTVSDNITADYIAAVKAQDTAGANFTALIVNPEVNGDAGWTISRPKGGNGPLLGGTAFEYWGGSASPRADAQFDYYQVIEGLPNGKYLVSADMYNSLNGEPGATWAASSGLYANNEKVLVETDGDQLNNYSVEVSVTSGTLRIGVKNFDYMAARWFVADNFKLTLVESGLGLDDYYNTIAALLEEADGIAGKQSVETSEAFANAVEATAGYNSVADQDALQTMIDDLTTAIENSKASVNAYAELKKALEKNYFADRSDVFGIEFTYHTEAEAMYADATATTDEVNAKANGMLNAYRDYVKAIAADGYPEVAGVAAARENASWEYTTDPKNNAVFNNPGNMDINGNTMWENWKGNGLDGDMKQTVTGLPDGKYFLRMVSFTRNSINENDYIYIKSGDAEAKALSMGDASNSNGFVNITDPIEVTNGEVEIGLHIGSGADWAAIGGVVLYAVPEDITRTTATEKYGTICAPFAAKAEGAKVYSAAVNGNEVELEDVENMVAGTPYIYQATEDAQTFSYASGNIVAAPVANGPLTGVFTATQVPVGSYVMQTQNNAQKFYIVAEGKQPTLSANKAYLTVPTTTEAKVLSIGFAEETAIKAIDALMSGDAKIYDLNGREQKSLQKGVNIVNGVKVLVK